LDKEEKSITTPLVHEGNLKCLPHVVPKKGTKRNE